MVHFPLPLMLSARAVIRVTCGFALTSSLTALLISLNVVRHEYNLPCGFTMNITLSGINPPQNISFLHFRRSYLSVFINCALSSKSGAHPFLQISLSFTLRPFLIVFSPEGNLVCPKAHLLPYTATAIIVLLWQRKVAERQQDKVCY